ncbi:MAG: DUF2505 domain-containing protein [Terracoccus sp.]
MTTSVREDREIPLTVAQVLDVLRSPAHWEARVRDAGEGRLELTGLEVSDTGVEATLTGPVPLDWLPSVVRARVTSPPSIRRVERWTAVGDGPGGPPTALAGVLDFTVTGVSATVAGTGTVRPVPTGSRIVVDLAVGVDMPFIGGLIEQAIASQIGPNLARELALIGR